MSQGPQHLNLKSGLSDEKGLYYSDFEQADAGCGGIDAEVEACCNCYQYDGYEKEMENYSECCCCNDCGKAAGKSLDQMSQCYGDDGYLNYEKD